MFMPFGFCSTLAMSVWLMKFILQDLTYKACLVHFDGVIVAGQMFQEQIYNLQKVFQRF
jgi:hypothetical protein